MRTETHVYIPHEKSTYTASDGTVRSRVKFVPDSVCKRRRFHECFLLGCEYVVGAPGSLLSHPRWNKIPPLPFTRPEFLTVNIPTTAEELQKRSRELVPGPPSGLLSERTLHRISELLQHATSVDEVISFLQWNEVSGEPDCPEHCPIAEYLDTRMLRVHSEHLVVAYHVPLSGLHDTHAGRIVLYLPQAIRDFIKLFDANQLPDVMVEEKG